MDPSTQINEYKNDTEDEFIIIGATKYKLAISELNKRWPDIEIFAPIERRMIRPRRKSSAEPIWVERPLFMQYIAIRKMIDWIDIFGLRGVKFILENNDEPITLRRRHLLGMTIQNIQRSWDGCMVEIVSGPLSGQVGIYNKGQIEIDFLGSRRKTKINIYDLSMI